MCQRGANGALSEFVLGHGGQARCDIHAARHPRGLAAKQPGNARLAEALLAHQGTDDAGFVEGGEGAWRGVGLEQQALVLFGRARPLENDGDKLVSLLAPTLQTFEAIDDLVADVVGGYDADGQLSRIVGNVVRRSGSETCVGCSQTVNRQKADIAGGFACGR